MAKDYSAKSLAEVIPSCVVVDNLRNAHTCDNCSKLRRWLAEQSSKCPNCSVSLPLRELVECPWIEGVLQQSDATLEAVTERELTQEDKCKRHSGNLDVYCGDCKQRTCYECFMWGYAHSGHDIQPFYKEQQMEQIKQKYDDKLRHLPFKVSAHPKQQRSTKTDTVVRDEFLRRLNVTKDMLEMVKSKLQRLETMNSISQRAKLIGNHCTLIERKLSTYSKIKRLNSSTTSHQIIVADIQKRSASSSDIAMDSRNERLPPFANDIFVLRDFSILQQRANPVYSPILNVRGSSWRLKVYPKGNGVARGHYLSVYLELTAGLPETLKYEFRVEIVHPRSAKKIVRELEAYFHEGENRGYKRFFSLDLLASEGYLDTVSDILILEFKVRPLTYSGNVYWEQQLYKDKLETIAKKYQMNRFIQAVKGFRDQDVLNRRVRKEDVTVSGDHTAGKEHSSRTVPSASASSGFLSYNALFMLFILFAVPCMFKQLSILYFE